jgi:hypothetical protein
MANLKNADWPLLAVRSLIDGISLKLGSRISRSITRKQWILVKTMRYAPISSSGEEVSIIGNRSHSNNVSLGNSRFPRVLLKVRHTYDEDPPVFHCEGLALRRFPRSHCPTGGKSRVASYSVAHVASFKELHPLMTPSGSLGRLGWHVIDHQAQDQTGTMTWHACSGHDRTGNGL